MIKFSLAANLLVVLSACTTVTYYRVPALHENFATIQENDPVSLERLDRQYVRIHSIDREYVRRGISGHPIPEIRPLDSDYGIWLSPGEHQIYAQACVHKTKALINAGWQCAETVLRFNAAPGVNYMIKGDIYRKQDYADFWIENLTNRRKVTDTVRVSGFSEAQ